MPHSYQTFKQWNAWLPSDFLGKQILAAEKSILSNHFPSLYGKHISLIGVPAQRKLLTTSKLPCHSLISPLFQLPHDALDIGYIESDLYELPILTGGLDAVILPHTLELVDNPRQLLAEVCRIIKPEGLLILFGFNPFGPWGVRKWWGKNQGLPWSNHFISATEVKKWLNLAEFCLEQQHFLLHRIPLRSWALYERLKFYEWVGDKCLPNLGGVYMLIARAKVIPLTPIRTTWKQKIGSIRVSTSFSGPLTR